MTANREAIIRLTVSGLRQQRNIEAIIDTGFTAFLTLPRKTVEDLELPFQRRGWALLADGSEVSFDVHEAEISWDGGSRKVDVSVADTEPLVGTSLLEGHELNIRFVDDGEVSIEAVSGTRI